MEKEYSFIRPEYDELFAREQQKDLSKVFYFEKGTILEEANGKITGIWRSPENEDFMVFEAGDKVRVDRIITINGKPGPAYDEYDRFGLACLDCSGGMD